MREALGSIPTPKKKRQKKKKYPSPKRAGRMAQVLEHLSSKHEALSSTPVPHTKKKKETEF
jgi:hypothetical protein